MREQKGVTLIMLAITVMVLVIIVGVMVTAGLGQKSQVKEVIQASEQSYHDNIKDALLVIQTNHTSKKEYIEYLQNHEYMNYDNELNVRNLLEAADCEYGLGSNFKDVYVLSNDLNLTYYDKDGKQIDLGNLSANMEE